MCLGLVVHTLYTLWTEWLNFVCKKVVLIGPRSARVPAVCGTIKRPRTIKNLTKPVFTHLSHQVSNKKLHLRFVLGKTITILIGKWAVLEIFTEVLKS